MSIFVIRMFLTGSIVSLFFFVSFLMTVECILTDDFMVMIMGRGVLPLKFSGTCELPGFYPPETSTNQPTWF